MDEQLTLDDEATFMVFAGNVPQGGWSDKLGTYYSLEDAQYMGRKYDWYQIVKLTPNSMVCIERSI